LVGDSPAQIDSNAMKQGWVLFGPLDHGLLSAAIATAPYRVWVSCAADQSGTLTASLAAGKAWTAMLRL
jgi:hypothetical protein